jgi:hypothetical protein
MGQQCPYLYKDTNMKHSLFQENRQDEVAEEIQNPDEDNNQMALHLAKALVSILKANRPKIEHNEMDDEEC